MYQYSSSRLFGWDVVPDQMGQEKQPTTAQSDKQKGWQETA